MNGIIVLLFEYIQEGFEKSREFWGFDHMGCQEI